MVLIMNKIFVLFFFAPSYPPSRAVLLFLSFAMWGATRLVEWFSPGHYLNLMLETVTGYQETVPARLPVKD